MSVPTWYTRSAMPQHAAKRNPPGGKRVSEVERERRLQAVAQLASAGHSRAAIVTICRSKLGMSVRTVDEYLAEVKRRWAAASSVNLREQRGRMLQRLDDLGLKLERGQRW